MFLKHTKILGFSAALCTLLSIPTLAMANLPMQSSPQNSIIGFHLPSQGNQQAEIDAGSQTVALTWRTRNGNLRGGARGGVRGGVHGSPNNRRSVNVNVNSRHRGGARGGVRGGVHGSPNNRRSVNVNVNSRHRGGARGGVRGGLHGSPRGRTLP